MIFTQGKHSKCPLFLLHNLKLTSVYITTTFSCVRNAMPEFAWWPQISTVWSNWRSICRTREPGSTVWRRRWMDVSLPPRLWLTPDQTNLQTFWWLSKMPKMISKHVTVTWMEFRAVRINSSVVWTSTRQSRLISSQLYSSSSFSRYIILDV